MEVYGRTIYQVIEKTGSAYSDYPGVTRTVKAEYDNESDARDAMQAWKTTYPNSVFTLHAERV